MPTDTPNKSRSDTLQIMEKGGSIVFDNATDLYKEAILLGDNGFTTSAVTLHQISMEECAKVHMIGELTIGLLAHDKLDLREFGKKFRDHKVKNFINAYSEQLSDEEKEAMSNGDYKTASDLFSQNKHQFHQERNSMKNNSLYVDFNGTDFVSPRDVINEDDYKFMRSANEEMLNSIPPFLKVLKNLCSNPDEMTGFLNKFFERMKVKRDEMLKNPESISIDDLFNEAMVMQYKEIRKQ